MMSKKYNLLLFITKIICDLLKIYYSLTHYIFSQTNKKQLKMYFEYVSSNYEIDTVGR